MGTWEKWDKKKEGLWLTYESDQHQDRQQNYPKVSVPHIIAPVYLVKFRWLEHPSKYNSTHHKAIGDPRQHKEICVTEDGMPPFKIEQLNPSHSRILDKDVGVNVTEEW